MRLNLGCGRDIREGYVNVDIRQPCDLEVDLGVLPWPFESSSVTEVLMFDVLEHFSYRKTDAIIQEVWRVLSVGGVLDVQVPDFTHCANAAMDSGSYLCNKCGCSNIKFQTIDGEKRCPQCGSSIYRIAQAALDRLYGGQDYEGNWHYAAFTQDVLRRKLQVAGFGDITFLERNEQGETYWQNWNFRIRAMKREDAWD